MERVEQVESIVHLMMVNLKGKVAEVPTSKLHNKRKKSKTFIEETPKKVKLLAFAISVVRKTKVRFALCLSM